MDDGTQNDIDHLLLEALNAHNAREYRRAIAIYTRILEGEPPQAIRSIIYVHRGMAWFSESRYADARRDFEAALENDPGNYRAWYLRGSVHSLQRNYPEALSDFSESLRLNPFQHDPLYSRAWILCRMGRDSEALRDCRKALGLFPESEEVRRLLREVRGKMKESG